MRKEIHFKAISILLIFMLTLSILSGCQNNSNGGKSGQARTYTFATWAAGEELKDFQEIIDRVNLQADGAYKVEVLSFPSDYYIKLSTKIAGKKVPDFFWLTQELIAKYAELGAIADLTDQLNASEKLKPDTFYPGVLAAATYKDKYYGIPWIANPLMVYYNQDLFEEAGIAFPDPLGGWTWDDFLQIAKQLTVQKTDSQGNAYQQYGYIVDGWPNIETFFWAGGGDIISDDGNEILMDTPQSLEGLNILHEILISKVTPQYSKVSSLGSNNVWFEKQRAAMFMGGIQDNFEEKISKLPQEEQFKIGYAPMPVCADGRASGFDWTASTVVSSKLQGDSQAYQVLEAITEEFFQWKIASPIMGTVDQVAVIDPLKAPALPTIEVCLKNARSANYISKWNEINDMLWYQLYNPLLSDPENFDYITAAKNIAEKSRQLITAKE